MTTEAAIAAFISRYDVDTFAQLIDSLERRESGPSIALRLGVNRQQVSIWRKQFGQTITHYLVDPTIKRFAASLPDEEDS